mgnify:CR=1 FL=1
MLIAANWKMNNDLNDINDFYKFFQAHEISPDVDMCIIPQHPLIYEAKKLFEKTKIKIGSQSSHYKSEGPFTGDVSPQLLSNIGCEYVITGHSERRLYHFENDEFIKNTVLSIISNHLVPIICLGETLEDRQGGDAKNVIKKQIHKSIPLIKDCEIIVAYEPLWAIGSGIIPKDSEIEEVHTLIKNELNSLSNLLVLSTSGVTPP